MREEVRSTKWAGLRVGNDKINGCLLKAEGRRALENPDLEEVEWRGGDS
jgi:hypothetical protein